MRVRLQDRLRAADLERLARAGELAAALQMRLFLAGGSVRDALLGAPSRDWDVTVEGDGPRFARELARSWAGRVTVHDRFLTASVRLADGTRVDVTTAREETYPQPGALPVVRPATMERDLWRRDFSINALAVSLGPEDLGAWLDPTGGLQDLEARRVRALHPRSFWDDATRIVRAVGFEQRLGFALEPATEEWLRQAARDGALQTVSPERLGEALLPLLGGAVGPAVLWRGGELGLAGAWGGGGALPPRAIRALGEVDAALAALQAQGAAERGAACLAALIVGRAAAAEALIRSLHLDRLTTRALRGAERQLRAWPDGFAPAGTPAELRHQLQEAGFGGVVALWLASDQEPARRALVEFWTTWRHVTPDIAAADLEALGYAPGPAYAAALRAALDAKLSRQADAATQLEAARQVLQTDADCPTD